jgi:hypothetical protein
MEEYGCYIMKQQAMWGDMENDCQKGSKAATGSPLKQLIPNINRK